MRKDWDNGIHELKPKFVYLYVKDKKNEQFQNYCNHFWGIRYVNLLFKKDCKGVEFLTKIYVFLYIMVDHKMAKETNKREVESICKRITKHTSKKFAKAEISLNWLWIVLIVYLYHNYFMISLFPVAPAPEVHRPWNLTGTLAWNVLKFFFLCGKKYYFIQELKFLINNLCEHKCQKSTLTLCKN